MFSFRRRTLVAGGASAALAAVNGIAFFMFRDDPGISEIPGWFAIGFLALALILFGYGFFGARRN